MNMLWFLLGFMVGALATVLLARWADRLSAHELQKTGRYEIINNSDYDRQRAAADVANMEHMADYYRKHYDGCRLE